MTGYLRPVDPTGGRICTYWTHCHRTIPSQEAGVDYYTPIGTPVRAAGPGVVYATGGGVEPATGRYLTLDLDDGRRVRYLHLSEWIAKPGQRVSRGTIVAKSGASGYGTEFFGASSLAFIPADTGGPHVHTTLWAGHYYRFGQYPLEPTLDFELYVDKASTSGNGSTPFPTEVDMPLTAQDVALIWGYKGAGTTDAWQLLHDAITAASAQGITPAQIWAYAGAGTTDAWQKLSDAKAAAPAIDYAALAAAIVKAGGTAPTPDAIATAVRAKFASNPLV